MWALASGDVAPGWAVMNGSDNAAPAGSGIDMTDRFVRGSSSSGGLGGTPDHTHTWELEIAPHTEHEIATSLNHTHTFSVPDHSISDLDHEHPLVPDTPSNQNGWDATTTEEGTPYIGCTEGPEEAGLACDGTAWGPLSHGSGTLETDPSYEGGEIGNSTEKLYHAFFFEIDSSEHLPLYVELIFIERINNSV